jgi:hypothetical protein
MDVEKEFTPSHGGIFMERSGPANHEHSDVSQRKLCLVATDHDALIELLYELSQREDCYYVKYSTKARDGMFLGRCFLTTDIGAGELWRELKPHPKFMCTIQDDDFTRGFRQIDDSI